MTCWNVYALDKSAENFCYDLHSCFFHYILRQTHFLKGWYFCSECFLLSPGIGSHAGLRYFLNASSSLVFSLWSWPLSPWRGSSFTRLVGSLECPSLLRLHGSQACRAVMEHPDVRASPCISWVTFSLFVVFPSLFPLLSNSTWSLIDRGFLTLFLFIAMCSLISSVSSVNLHVHIVQAELLNKINSFLRLNWVPCAYWGIFIAPSVQTHL